MAVLNEANILMDCETLFFRPTPHSDRSASLTNLCLRIGWLGSRFLMTSSMTDLEEAISMLREVLSLCLATHLHRLLALENLVFIPGLEIRFKENGVQSDNDEVTSLHQEIFAMSKLTSTICLNLLFDDACSKEYRVIATHLRTCRANKSVFNDLSSTYSNQPLTSPSLYHSWILCL